MTDVNLDVPVRELAGPPPLPLAFARAALGALPFGGRSGGDLPTEGLALTDVRIDRAHLAEYDRVCGFRLSDAAPVTYPHLLVFGLQAALMTGDGFPYPMIGLVHVANRISWTRPVRAGEPLVVRTHAANPRPHDRGVQFDLVSAALADGEPVWTEVTTYLRRTRGSGGSGGGARESAPVESPDAVWRLPGDLGRRYARVSGDHNPIHLHPLSAKVFGFPRAIAHGMWSLARCVAFYEGALPSAGTVDARFKLPVPLPATVALTASADRFALADRRSGRPHVEGTIA